MNIQYIWLRYLPGSLLLLLFCCTGCNSDEATPAMKPGIDSTVLVGLNKQIEDHVYYNIDSAFYYVDKLSGYYFAAGDTSAYLDRHIRKSNIYTQHNQPQQALRELENYRIARDQYHMDEQPYLFIGIGNIYMTLGMPRIAQKNYEKALQLFMKQNDLFGISLTDLNFSMVYDQTGQSDSAFFYLEKAYHIRHDIMKDELLSAHILQFMGKHKLNTGKTGEAKKYLYQAYTIFRAHPEKSPYYNEEETYLGMMQLYCSENNYDSLMYFYHELEAKLESKHDQVWQSNIYSGMAGYLLSMHHEKEAAVFKAKFDQLDPRFKTYKDEIAYNRFLYRHYTQAGNEALANRYGLAYFKMNDSFNSINIRDNLIKTNYELLEMQNNLVVKNKNDELDRTLELARQQKIVRNYIYLIAGILFFSTLLALGFYRKASKDRRLIAARDREKELLLKEIHHRVKNNLAVISGILDLQQREIADQKVLDIFLDAKLRVNSIALVHRNLYEQDHSGRADCRQYFSNLCATIHSTYRLREKKIDTHIDMEGIMLNADTLVPLALMINELLTNTYKYAFADRLEGSIDIRIKKTDSRYLLSYRDNGCGLPAGFDPASAKSLGSRLIRRLAQQLEGTVEVRSSDEGLAYFIVFNAINT